MVFRASNAARLLVVKRRERCSIKEAHMSRALIARVMTLGAIALCLQSPAAQAQERDLKFVLDFISLGRHAPWYVALGKGYFKDEGLNVSIMPSKGTPDAIRTVATGGAEIGFIDIPSLVASGSAGANVKIVAANYQKPPYCIFTLNPGANVTEPKQMAGLELGSDTASFVAHNLAGFIGDEQGGQPHAQDRQHRRGLARADARRRQSAIDRSVPHERARHSPRRHQCKTGLPVRRGLRVG